MPAEKTAQFQRIADRLKRKRSQTTERAEGRNELAKLRDKVEKSQADLERLSGVKPGMVNPQAGLNTAQQATGQYPGADAPFRTDNSARLDRFGMPIQDMEKYNRGTERIISNDNALMEAARAYIQQGEVELGGALKELVQMTAVSGGAKSDPEARGALWRAIYKALDPEDRDVFDAVTEQYQKNTDTAVFERKQREAKKKRQEEDQDVPF